MGYIDMGYTDKKYVLELLKSLLFKIKLCIIIIIISEMMLAYLVVFREEKLTFVIGFIIGIAVLIRFINRHMKWKKELIIAMKIDENRRKMIEND